MNVCHGDQSEYDIGENSTVAAEKGRIYHFDNEIVQTTMTYEDLLDEDLDMDEDSLIQDRSREDGLMQERHDVSQEDQEQETTMKGRDPAKTNNLNNNMPGDMRNIINFISKINPINFPRFWNMIPWWFQRMTVPLHCFF